MPVTGVEIRTKRPFGDGEPFGDVGPYEELSGIFRFEVDPLHSANNRVTDVGSAPLNSTGKIEFSSDFTLLRPVDSEAGNGRLLFDVLNRGRKAALGTYNEAETGAPGLYPFPSEDSFDEAATHFSYSDDFMDPGNGWLMRNGWTVLWTGWQVDVPPYKSLMRLYAPSAVDSYGKPFIGKIFSQFQSNTHRQHFLLSDREHVPHPALDIDEAGALLTVREQPDYEPVIIPRERWEFARVVSGRVIPDKNYVHLVEGFESGLIYQLTYTTSGSPILGLGFLAMRDSISLLRHESLSDPNLRDLDINYTYAWGSSQSGRFLRTFLNLDLNLDECGREVLDGVVPHVAGGMRGEFNQRFGQPSKDLPSVIAQLFPFTDVESMDTDNEKSGALLSRILARNSGIKVCFTNTSAEYWRGDASLIHTDPGGNYDIAQSPGVRIYHFSGTQHGVGSFPPEQVRSGDLMKVQNFINSINYAPLSRAVLENLHNWVAYGTEPPPSNHPKFAEKTAASATSLETIFGKIPNANFPPHVPVPMKMEFGLIESPEQSTRLPPVAGRPYGSVVASVNDDGNEIAGVPVPDVSVPLATYTGWNLRHESSGAPYMLAGLTGGLTGSTIPFPANREEAERTGDPRISIEERYGSKSEYLNLVRIEAERLVGLRYILETEIDLLVEQAGSRWDWFLDPDRSVQEK